jgi:hypothetical protein
MSRGNQREIDRARAAARKATEGKKSVGDPNKKKEEDGNALKAKLEAKAAKQAAEKEAAEAKAAFEAQKGAGEQKESAVVGKVAAPPAKKKVKEDLSFLTDMAKGGPKGKGK